MTRQRRNGFTLLEVIVAVAILGLSLVAIFGSESGAMRTTSRARHYHVATLLARCKMGEIEEQVGREGFPAVDDRERDECCEGAEVEGYRCEWSIEPVVLPSDPASSQGSSQRPQTTDEQASAAMGRVGSAGDFLAGGGNRGGLEDMLLSVAVPVLRPAIESQVRRANVTVRWDEGEVEHTLDVAQFLVNERQPNAEVIQNQMNRINGTARPPGSPPP